jgi:steroid delta-isomerase
MVHPLFAACLGLLAIALSPETARADEAADKAAIAARLRGFADAFNARDEAGLCDIFASDLIATVPPRLETDAAAICGHIDRLLARPDLWLHYDDPDIREIIVSGDIAVVRVLWTLDVEKGGERDSSPEGGIDVFRRQQDGRWSIARMATFTLRPNKLLD